MGAVDIGIGHDDDLVVAELAHVGGLGVLLGADGDAQGLEHVHDLLALEDLVVHGFLHVEDLAAQGQDGLVVGIAALLCGASCGVALDQEELAFGGVAAVAVGELAGKACAAQGRLALHLHAGVVGGVAGLGGQHHFVDDDARLLGMLLQVVAQGLADGRLHHAHHLVVAQLGLGLALELRLGDLDGDDGREAVAEVLLAQFYVLELVKQVVLVGVFLEGGRQAAAKARQVRAALDGVDVVDEREDVLVERGVVCHGDLDGNAAAYGAEVDDVGDEGFLALVDVADELLEPLVGVEDLAAGPVLFVALALVGERQGDAGVEEGQVAQAVGQRAVVVDCLGEDVGVGMEGDGGAGVGGLAGDGELGDGLALAELLHVDLAVACDFGAEHVAEGVDAADAYAVQAAGHLVRAFVELASGMEHGEHDLQGRLVQLGVHVDGDAAAVVDHAYGVVLEYGDVDVAGVAGQGLVDGVVHHLVDQVVQAARARVADVHRRALAHGLQAFEHLDVVGRVMAVVLLLDCVYIFFHCRCQIRVCFRLRAKTPAKIRKNFDMAGVFHVIV